MKFVNETEFTLEEVLAIAQGDYFALIDIQGNAFYSLNHTIINL